MMNRRFIKIAVVGCMLFFALTQLTIAQRDVGNRDIHYTAQFFRDRLNFGKLDGYDVIYMKDAAVFSELGRPVVPVVYLKIALPTGAEVVAVEAKPLGSSQIPGEYYVMPGQPPLPTPELDEASKYPEPTTSSAEELAQPGSQLLVAPDQNIYGSRVAYPYTVAQYISQGDLAGQKIAEVAVYPLQYIPQDKKLILHTRVELIITCRSAIDQGSTERYAIFTERQRQVYEDVIKTMVVNPQNVVLNPTMREMSRALPAGEYDHVIITSSTYEPYFQPLVEWYTKRGMKDTVVTTNWIYANYSGPGDTLKIRQFVIDAAGTWGTMYFLMGGENTIVPFAYRAYYDQNTPSDQYYSDYDDDWTNEVFVGRVSIDASAQVNTFVNKVLKYEIDPPVTGYPLNVLLIGMDADGSTPLEDVKETIAGWIPGNFTITKVYDSQGGNHKTAAITALNAGQNLVNHADHSSETVMGVGDFHHGWYLSRSDVNNLVNNDKMSVVVSLGCDPNSMDYSDCIAERWVIFNDYQAGVAFTGNTRHGYYYSGQPSSLSGILDKKWWQGLFVYDQDNLGKALVYSKHNFGHSQAINKHCEWTFNLLGEPAMPIWTDTPHTLDVTHPATIYRGMMRHFKVTATSDGSPVESSYVCLWKEDDIYKRGYTDMTGEVTLTIFPATVGTLSVTVTKHNYLPYQGETIVKSGGIIQYPDSIIAKPDTGLVNIDSIIPKP
jgi:hypothetical protein